jgi:hypothetical protein
MKLIIFYGCSFLLMITIFILVTVYPHPMRTFLQWWCGTMSIFNLICFIINTTKYYKQNIIPKIKY